MRGDIASVVVGAALGALLAASASAAPAAPPPPAASAAPAARLSPAEIQSTFFTGQPFIAATPSKVRYKMTFSADGKMKREPTSGGTKGEGTWKLSKDGFCTTWNGAKSNCFTVVGAGANQWSVLRGSTIMATWSK